MGGLEPGPGPNAGHSDVRQDVHVGEGGVAVDHLPALHLDALGPTRPPRPRLVLSMTEAAARKATRGHDHARKCKCGDHFANRSHGAENRLLAFQLAACSSVLSD